MIKLLTKKIEKEICKTTKIFGENYTVQIMYKKIQNPELNLVGKTIMIYLPNKYKKIGNTQILKVALEKMYDEIARIEIENVMEETRIKLNGLAPDYYIIKRINNKLAETSKENKTITINPEIVKYNKQILRYVILHEFCHLKYKNHTKKFWEMVEMGMPEYKEYTNIIKVA